MESNHIVFLQMVYYHIVSIVALGNQSHNLDILPYYMSYISLLAPSNFPPDQGMPIRYTSFVYVTHVFKCKIYYLDILYCNVSAYPSFNHNASPACS